MMIPELRPLKKGHYCWDHARRFAIGRYGVQRYRCARCGRTFPAPPGLPQHKTLSCEWNRGRRDRITPAVGEIWVAWMPGGIPTVVEIIEASRWGDRCLVRHEGGEAWKYRRELPYRLWGVPGSDPDD